MWLARSCPGKSWGSLIESGFSSSGGEDEGNCEVNGRVYQDGETFQPHCRIRCHCQDGGFTCVPLCSEDIRLPSWDCPYPRKVEVPGKCCPEWVCDQGRGLGFQPLPVPGEFRAGSGPRAGPPGGVGMGRGILVPGHLQHGSKGLLTGARRGCSARTEQTGRQVDSHRTL